LKRFCQRRDFLMKIQVVAGSIVHYPADAIVVFAMRNGDNPNLEADPVNEALNDALINLINDGDFAGKAGEAAILYSHGAILAKRVLLVGLGESSDFTADALRRAMALALQKARALKLKHVAVSLLNVDLDKLDAHSAARALAEGGLLGLYQYHGQKTSEAPQDLPEVLDVVVSEADFNAVQAGVAAGEAFAAGASLARYLVALPPNICTPTYLGDQAVQLGQAHPLKVTVLEKHQIQTLKMGALLAVAQGSAEPPRFIVMEHKPELASANNTIVLIGKGVTFDTGGYSMKPADAMIGMKGDMGGAAAVIGAMKTIAMLDLPVHVVGLVPSADNLISGDAFLPQAVITASNGKTIEIISTDAEGRLLLADALVYAKRYNPAAVIDIATLTGAIMIALGSPASGVFTNDESLVKALHEAGTDLFERVWHMPLYPEYSKMIESDTADVKNSAGFGQRGGGAGVGAAFLTHFVDYPSWAHVDMAGKGFTDNNDTAYVPKGATGYGARLLAEFVLRRTQA
jgi:leucyl aminopeptidase